MSEIEKDEKVLKIIKTLKKPLNIYFESRLSGPLEFRQFNFKDFSKVHALSEESLNEKEFTIRLIFGLIVEPKISLNEFKEITDSELISIIRQICDKNENLQKFFRDPADDRVFIEFKEAVKKYNDEKIKEFTKVISSINNSFIKTLSNNILKISIPQIIITQMNVIQSWMQLNRGLFENIFQSVKELTDSLAKYHSTVEDANKILKKYKWFVSLSLPGSFYGAVLQIEKSGAHKRLRINRLFIEYFSSNDYKTLEKMVEDWKDNPHFKPRMKIFRNCIKTLKRARHDENPSIIIIPA
jgi:hypothetical protein